VLLQVPAAIGSKNQQALAVATGHSVVVELTILSFVSEGTALIQAAAMTHCEAAVPDSSPRDVEVAPSAHVPGVAIQFAGSSWPAGLGSLPRGPDFVHSKPWWYPHAGPSPIFAYSNAESSRWG
jgi:hypothetical protein